MTPIARHGRLQREWADPPGWRGSLSAVNHTLIGKRFMLTALAFFVVGGILAMLVRAQLAVPGNPFLDSTRYNQLFTMHGTVMMFLFAIPMLEGFALYLLPKMLGTRDLAYPRLGAYAYWCYLFGGLLLLGGLALGVAPQAGWFMYTPLSGTRYSPGLDADLWLIGVTFAEISAICAGVELITSILLLRAPGMSLDRMPLFAWYMLATAGMILVGFPPLILGSILLELERALDWPFFDPSRGGDPLLWQHLFWMFGHPEVYVIFLPAAGMVSTMLPALAGHRLVGHAAVAASVVLLAALSFGLWVHHMFTVGIPHLAQSFFSIASMLVAVPTGIQVFAWLATLWCGRPRLHLPMLYLAGFLFVFVCGGLTGVMLALVPFNWQAHDTHFVVAHLHYVLVGGLVFPLMAATYYWMPHVTGRMPSDRAGRWAFWLIFGGFNAAFLPMHLTGLLGMPRRIYTYPTGLGWDGLNLLTSIAAFVLAIGLALFLLDVLVNARLGVRAPRNPWGAGTLEWATATPVASYNFASLPEVEEAYPLWHRPGLGARAAGGDGWLDRHIPGVRELLAVDPISGAPRAVLRIPGPSPLPLAAALATAAVFLSVLAKQYLLAGCALAAMTAVFLAWAWRGRRLQAPPPVAGLHTGGGAPAPGLWGTGLALVADATCYGALLFGYAFLWRAAPAWPPPAGLATGGVAPWLVLAALAAGTLASSSRAGLRGALPAAGAAIVAVAALAWLQHDALPDGRQHAYAAVARALLAYVLLHAAVAGLLSGFVAWTAKRGSAPLPPGDVAARVMRLWWRYTAVTGAATLAALYGPALAGAWQ
ncbi:cytochrome c oxidase subunit I [Bordetella sp. 2513F-2]